MGYLIRVFDRISSEPLDSTSGLEHAGLLFPPVFVGLPVPVRRERWKRIGNMTVQHFMHPKFRETIGTKPGTYHDWRVWDGRQTVKVGDLPDNMRSLELLSVWGDEALENRIISGTYSGDEMF
jgi:Immunity protein 26